LLVSNDIPLIKLRPVQSTCVETIILVVNGEAHIKHVLVFTENTPPLGTSGFRVVVRVET
jgi:hypothetical protein